MIFETKYVHDTHFSSIYFFSHFRRLFNCYDISKYTIEFKMKWMMISTQNENISHLKQINFHIIWLNNNINRSALFFADIDAKGVLDTTLCNKMWQWFVAGLWFFPGTPVSSTNKTDRHDITEILLKVVLNTINQTKPNLCISDLSLPLFWWVINKVQSNLP